MKETNWSEWIPYDGKGQPVADYVKTDIAFNDQLETGYGTMANRCPWSEKDITHYRYDLDHPDAPKLPDWEEGERRMRDISSNGNTGEHYEPPQPYWTDDREDELTSLAVRIAEWPEDAYTHAYRCEEDGEIKFCRLNQAMTEDLSAFTREEISAYRARLGMQPFLVELQYDPSEVAFKPERSKYHREIKPGVWVDVYDVLHAWGVKNPALQHLIKKALQPGERGHKTKEQDMADIVASALRARELER
jgi:hypothetical protein